MVRGHGLNKRDKSIQDAWMRLYICITTDDINEFYMAYAGHKPYKAKEGNYTWREINKTKPIRREKNEY